MNSKILSIAAAAFLAMGAASCSDYLDKEVDLTLQADNVFSDYDRTRGYLAQLYDYLPDAFQGYSDTQYRLSQDCMTDNAVDYWGVARYHSVVADAYDATNHWFADFYWDRDFRGIRGINQYLLNARPDVVGNAEKNGDDNRLYDRWDAEARVLRAILHFDLLSWYGDIPIVADDENGTPIILSPGVALPERMAAADVLQWIADECDKYKDKLPFRYSNEAENWGRINGAAAYALKTRALLYRASPLFNPGNESSRWTAAANAAKDFINKNRTQSNPYRLYTTDSNDPNQNYYQCFVSNPVLNNEYILSRSVWTNTLQIEYFNAPCGFTGAISATGYLNPTQNLVDAYETINGLPIDKDPTYNEQNPYVNRDPRLEQTILHHGSMWGDGDEERMVDVNNDDTRVGADYARGNGGTATGYYSKKYLINIRWDGTVGGQRHACPIFRYAEILLAAAEALNETGQTSEAYEYVNQVRGRVGMPAYSGMSQDELRERIQNETRIEFCFEDHRYFDVRRWKLFEKNGGSASAESSLPRYRQVFTLYGVAVKDGTPQTFNYGLSDVDSHYTFAAPKNYFFPIPYAELQKTGYPQTPGWEL